ncbi:glutamine synthetase nodule isozyme-like isoform X2 [Vicia villosa]|uniref:glutamine synthetase nodule isozyme-like isoform X2 n=1 Tax=Vicia villosa TaxID=3911 RepID=UPI00273AC03B|nr:glutamine synthetase nodule isozyme-like isoform X2 [Vicia villosa]
MKDILSMDLKRLSPHETRKIHFSSLDMAYAFYNQYAKMNGFAICRSKILRSKKGEILQRAFVCHRQGFRDLIENIPHAIFKDPFRRGNHILVMCDAYTPAGEPIPSNKRHAAAKVFSHPDVVAEETWYGIKQEYTLLQKDINWPLGWPAGGYPGPHAFSHDIFYAHCKACLFAGINISGINGEVMLGQWEFQVGPSVGISAGDEIWVARYTLEIIIEVADLVLIFDPKPVKGDWNGVGAHTNYSTKSMREEGGYEIIKKAIEKLRKRHAKHITACGEGKERRLTGKHETTDINTFSWLKIRIHWIVQ